MERFFSKKSVAFFLTTIILFVFFSFSNKLFASSANTQTSVILAVAVPLDQPGYNNPYGANMGAPSSMQAPLGTTQAQEPIVNELKSESLGEQTRAILGDVLDFVKSGGNIMGGVATLLPFSAIMIQLTIWKTVVSYYLAITGAVFDLSINLSIVNIKDFLGPDSPLDGIWKMMRDLFNVSFIFLLLWVSITQIIGSMGVKAKTTLISIIISAVFINFSLFFTRLIIDLGNIVAIALYNSYDSYAMGLGIVDSSMRLFANFDFIAAVKSVLTLTGQTNIIAEQLLQMAVMFALMSVYLFGAMLLIGRTVMLVFLSIFSPIGFVGSSIPGFGDWSSKWWEAFINQVLVAPLMMFLLLIVSRLLEGNYLRRKIVATPEGFDLPGLNVPMYLFYIVIITFMILGMRMVKKLSGAVSTYALGAAKLVAVATAAVALAPIALPALGAAAAAGAGGAAAGAAGSGAGAAAARLGTRLVGAGKNFVTGKFSKSGVGGMVQSFARDQVLSGVKGATGGFVDVDKFLKMKKDGLESAKKNLTADADKIIEGPEKKLKELSSIKNNISAEAEVKVGGDSGAGEKLKKEFEAKEAKFNAMKEPDPQDPDAVMEHRSAKTDMNAANQKLTQFNDARKAALEQAENEIATEMGLSMTDLTTDLDAARVEMEKARKDRHAYITNVIEKGGGGFNIPILGIGSETFLSEKDAKELATSLRANKGKSQSAMDKLLKQLKDMQDNDQGGTSGGAGSQASSDPRNPNTAPVV